MTAAKGSIGGLRRRKKILKRAKGFRGRASIVFRSAVQRVEKALQYAYRDRRTRKRDMRSLWIQRINAASRAHAMPYGQFMQGLKRADIIINRKMLADIAVHDSNTFQALVERARSALKP